MGTNERAARELAEQVQKLPPQAREKLRYVIEGAALAADARSEKAGASVPAVTGTTGAQQSTDVI